MKIILSILLLCTFLLSSENKKVTILTDRAEFHMKSLIEWYKINKPEIQLNVIYIKDGLPIRALSDNSIDIIITNEVSNLGVLKEKGNLSNYYPKDYEYITKDLIKPGYGVISYRVRVFYYKNGKEPRSTSYLDLINNNETICIRPIEHNYNIGLAAQLLSVYDKETVQNIMNSIASKVTYIAGNDRDAVKGLYEGKCDIAIANTYYYAIMKNNPTQKEWVKDTSMYYPIEKELGTPILIGGIGITNTGVKNKIAIDFYNNIFSKELQTVMTNINYQYPVRLDIEYNDMLKSFNNNPKFLYTNLNELNKNREIAIEIVTKANKLVK